MLCRDIFYFYSTQLGIKRRDFRAEFGSAWSGSCLTAVKDAIRTEADHVLEHDVLVSVSVLQLTDDVPLPGLRRPAGASCGRYPAAALRHSTCKCEDSAGVAASEGGHNDTVSPRQTLRARPVVRGSWVSAIHRWYLPPCCLPPSFSSPVGLFFLLFRHFDKGGTGSCRLSANHSPCWKS